MATTLLCLERVITGRGPAASLRCLGMMTCKKDTPIALLQAQAAPVQWKRLYIWSQSDVKHDTQRLGKARDRKSVV